MKPFEDHVDDLMAMLPLRILSGDRPLVRERIRKQLLALARDQRYACVEAISSLQDSPVGLSANAVRQAVMNAPRP